MVKKPKGVEALVTSDPPTPIEEITLRDWFAAFALQAFLQRNDAHPCENAYIYADEMILERKK